ncbi:MAG: hypothetical protein GTN76_12060 [Candidatus Aenigmarchaeota archaeon]|nr:hypothetical protein [Candidatus Aenigmarchaeota archaeon]
MNKFLILGLVVALMTASNVSAQESVVCIVYFTGDVCGDECKLTDSFMGGLINEYLDNLVAIKYNIDLSQENKNIFEAYGRTYNIPTEVPLVLFGRDDYISGMYNIFGNAEPKIYSLIIANGTNCPLESGYVPPGQVNPDDLPGEPEFYESETPEEDGEEDGGETPNGIKDENKTGGITIPTNLEDIQRIYEEDPLFLILVVVAIILIITLVIVFVKRS